MNTDQLDFSNLLTNKINEYIEEQARLHVRHIMSEIDIKSVISKVIEKTIKLKLDQFAFPDNSINAKAIKWDQVKLSGNHISDGIIRNFNSTGIQDRSTECQLTVLDDAVVVEGEIVSAKVKTNKIEAQDISVNNLEIKGRISNDSFLNQLIESVSLSVFESNIVGKDIDLKGTNITNNSKILLSEDSLGTTVINSNLRKVGTLTELEVRGDALFGNTLIVNSSGKVGINTEEPEGVLTIWDDNADLTIMKASKNNMYVGSTRGSELTLGINKDNHLEVKKEEIKFNKPINVMGLKISVVTDVPSHIGEANEIAFVKNAKQGQPFLFMCKGQNSWASLGVLIP